jgi:hypothetical protein
MPTAFLYGPAGGGDSLHQKAGVSCSFKNNPVVSRSGAVYFLAQSALTGFLCNWEVSLHAIYEVYAAAEAPVKPYF